MSSRFIDSIMLGPRRRRRQMMRRLAELDRLDRESALRLPPRPKTHRLGSALVALLLLAGVAGVVVVARHGGKGHPAAATKAAAGGLTNDTLNSGAVEAHLEGKVPTPGYGEKPSRLLPAVKAPAGTGGYRLENDVADPQARYDPCRPIHYVIRDQNTPAGGDELVREVVATLSKATGLQFIDDGSTTETPSLKRPAYDPSRYGNRWAPVLIAWSNPTQIPTLKGQVLGLGGSTGLSVGHGAVLVTGAVFLDTAQIASAQAAQPSRFITRAVIEHELGHVLGLAHVGDPTQIMYPDDLGLPGYGPGDLRGLAYAGVGACHPEV